MDTNDAKEIKRIFEIYDEWVKILNGMKITKFETPWIDSRTGEPVEKTPIPRVFLKAFNEK